MYPFDLRIICKRSSQLLRNLQDIRCAQASGGSVEKTGRVQTVEEQDMIQVLEGQ
jgi:hypothetical protein